MKGSGSAYFDGNSYLTGTGINLDTKSFSISFWSYATSYNTNFNNMNIPFKFIFSTNYPFNPNVQHTFLVIHFDLMNNKLVFGFPSAPNTKIFSTSTITNDINTWVHYCCIYDHANSKLEIYKNGILDNSLTTPTINYVSSSSIYNIGNTGAQYENFIGYLDDFRIFVGTSLNATQVLNLYTTNTITTASINNTNAFKIKTKYISNNFTSNYELQLLPYNITSNKADYKLKIVNDKTLVSRNILNLTDSGNIGINIDNPQSLLHLHNNNNLGEVKISLTDGNTGTNNNDGFAIIKDSNEKCSIWNYENTSLVLGTNNLERITVLNNGNVGIGTTLPTEKLDVNGNINVTEILKGGVNISNIFVTSNILQTNTTLNYNNLVNKPWINDSPNNNIYYTSGNVGIGTT
ncbi:MAG: LamG domain-containing protein, partial [Gemmatimonadaceae bacterium]|nr:LamG domain-containing protein [Gemmatimonadaceae bacterium]